MVYLNGEFEGGETEFEVPGHATIRIVPELVLLSDHGLRHQGATVKSGCKHVLRTDVMFRVRPLNERESTPSPESR